MNSVNLTGRLGGDPELKHTKTGKAVVSFPLAVRASRDTTYWFDVVAWNSTAEFICRYFRKGEGIEICGKLTQRRYEDQGGRRRNVVEVQADSVGFPQGGRRETAPANSDEVWQAITDTVDDAGTALENLGPVDDGDLPF